MKFILTETQFKRVISRTQQEFETALLLNEGQNEDRTLKILKDSDIENVDDIYKFIIGHDKSKNHKLSPVIANYYIHLTNNNEYIELSDTFKKLYEEKTIPDITLSSNNKEVRISFGNNRVETFDGDDFQGFKNFIDHFYYKGNTSNEVDIKKLYSVNANKIFSNDNFEVYYAASEQVCIKLFGKDNQDRLLPRREFCIGWGTLESPGSHYSAYRSDEGYTFYVVVDLKLLKEYMTSTDENKKDDPKYSIMVNVVGVKRDQEGKHFVWDQYNPGQGDRVRLFSEDPQYGEDSESVKKYMKYLENGGVRLSIFKDMKYIPLKNDNIEKMVKDPYNNGKFFNLSPNEKYQYVSGKASILTSEQITFMRKNMPLDAIKFFVENYMTLGELDNDAFLALGGSLQKRYIKSKLIQLISNSVMFTFDDFFKYIINDEFKKFAIEVIMSSFTDKNNPNQNEEQSRKVLSLLSPEEYFKSLLDSKNERIVISYDEFKSIELPENFGEYLVNATELYFKNLNIKIIPASIGLCKNLTNLGINMCYNLESLPSEIGNLSNLYDFSIGGDDENVTKDEPCDTKNKLTSLPETMGNLSNLQALQVSNSSLTETPKFISKLKELQFLRLNCNEIKTIDKSIFLHDPNQEVSEENKILKDLFFINFDNNPLDEPSTELVNQLS